MRNTAAILSLLVIGAGSSCYAFQQPSTRQHHAQQFNSKRQINHAINNRNEKPLTKLSMSVMDDVTEKLGNYVDFSSLTTMSIPPALLADMDKLFTTGLTLEQKLAHLASMYVSLPTSMQIAFAAVPILTTAYGVFYNLSHPEDGYRRGYEPYRRGLYDPLVAKAYYSRHPFLVAKRALELLRFSNGFIFSILYDKYILRDEEKYRKIRAQQLLELVQKAGPTAIKVGQALSVRPDLVPAEYAEALSTLQDRVPPFPSNEAKDLLRSELSASMMKLTNLSLEKPVASASIGQVYRGMASLSDGSVREVAVKVQRPDVLAEIALDLHIVREFAPTYQKITRSATDFQSLANEWGRGFIAELAYSEEAKNTKKFNKEMKERGLTAVTAPVVVDELSTDRILVTEWVSGTRLDRSTAGDVPRLCSVALNAYLLMLLETGTLHCDPHPGNLMRTDEGQLCILDWGMTLETDPNLQYSLLEFVAHLTSEDYDRVPEDLVQLGFLKAERLDTVRASGFLEPLTYVLQQAGQGGGGKKVRERIFAEYRERYPGLDDDELRYAMRDDMQKQIEEARKKESAVSGITMEVEELQKRNRDAFSIPEWFLYTSRAFLTLEGICLQADEDYSIIKSCFPYVARRLLNDGSPRSQTALKDLIYGAGDSIDVERLTDLAGGFSTYTTTQKVINSETANNINAAHDNKSNANAEMRRTSSKTRLADTEAAITLAKDGAEILLNPKGNFVQNLLVDETAAATSAQIKDALKDVLLDNPYRIKASLPLNLGSFLPVPLEKELAPFFEKSDGEIKAQALLNKVTAAAAPSLPTLPSLPNLNGAANTNGENDNTTNSASTNSGESSIDPEQLAVISRELRENLPKYAPLLGQLGSKFVATVLERTSEDIDRVLLTTEHNSEESPADTLVRTAARGLKSGAESGAQVLKSQRLAEEAEAAGSK
mmetsp:Transcript_11421/g.17180  ORF Transcript_11421/g.17180 Transcript_11421/m.17180 type:complete len:943 (-) Transcript_11421:117-2945(-)|eukprot:CAMPEP_0196819050 /NCGR_PEP_ID=MMETSP1362-20130617/68822_1 /TAXON_ID=163516 /ORGANISM="Leptocylindrus danicus, Strain CCMP1856" /LENGTH=942 /DNA_ID=CAMNT_0042197397 /DNA_START=42 /DNA_END=2870 /DNA_ORIENTATION=-